MNRLMIALAPCPPAQCSRRWPRISRQSWMVHGRRSRSAEARLRLQCPQVRNGRRTRRKWRERKSSKVKLCGKQGRDRCRMGDHIEGRCGRKSKRTPLCRRPPKDQLSAALKAEIAKVEAGRCNNAGTRRLGRATPAPKPPPPPTPAAPAAKSPAAAPGREEAQADDPLPGARRKGRGKQLFSARPRDTASPSWPTRTLAVGRACASCRRGDVRAQLALTPMRLGETYRSKLPGELCAGVASTKVEIQVMGSGQVRQTLGPYSLRC